MSALDDVVSYPSLVQFQSQVGVANKCTILLEHALSPADLEIVCQVLLVKHAFVRSHTV